MAILTKAIYLILLSFSLQLLTYTTATTAQETIAPVTASPQPVHLHYPRDDLQSFICQTTNTSPFSTHVMFGTDDMINRRGQHWCSQYNRDGSQCTQLFDYGTASMVMCGEYRAKLRCKEIGEIIQELNGNCARSFDGKARLAGKVIFSWGYISVGVWRVPDQPNKIGALEAKT